MKSNLLKISVFLLFVLAFASCDKDEDSTSEKSYRVDSVMWRLEDGDGETITERILSERRYVNSGNASVDVVIDFSESYAENSFFECDDPAVLNKLVGENYYTSLPTMSQALSSEYSSVSGVQGYLFAGEVKDLITHSDSLKYSFELQPQSKATIKIALEERKLRATYLVRFVEDKYEQDYFEVKGKWTGTFLGKLKSSMIISEIE